MFSKQSIESKNTQKAYLTRVKVKVENQKSIGIIKILIKETIFFGFN